MKAGRVQLCAIVLSLCSVWAADAAAAPMSAPAFSCATARGIYTRAICNNHQLGRMNREMRGLYQKSLLVGDRRSRVQDQSNWVTTRNKTCADKRKADLTSCLSLLLKARILELKDIVESARAPAEQPSASSPTSTPVTTALPAITSVAPVSATPSSATPSAIPAQTTAPAPAPLAAQNASPREMINADAGSRPTQGCAGAFGIIDRAICGNAVLNRWEDRLAKIYAQALDDPFRTVVADDQQRWLGDRVGNCGSLPSAQINDCVLQLTKRRLEALVQFINSRDDAKDRPAKVQKILAGKTTPPPGLDADTIDREMGRADQSEVALSDARSCIRRNIGLAKSPAVSEPKQAVALMSEKCFADFSRRLSALELSALAGPSFEMLVKQEIGAQK